jgi:hypothetical protein
MPGTRSGFILPDDRRRITPSRNEYVYTTCRRIAQALGAIMAADFHENPESKQVQSKNILGFASHFDDDKHGQAPDGASNPIRLCYLPVVLTA